MVDKAYWDEATMVSLSRSEISTLLDALACREEKGGPGCNGGDVLQNKFIAAADPAVRRGPV